MIPVNHSQRFILNDEVHARSYEALLPPERASYLVIVTSENNKVLEWEGIVTLCERYGCPPPPSKAVHWIVDLGDFRLKWEQHAECSSYTFFQRGSFKHPFENPVINLVPSEWLATLPGHLLVAAHGALQKREVSPSIDEISTLFDGHPLVGAYIGDNAGVALTDFRIHSDGFSRFFITDNHLGTRQAGRMIQRLFEIEKYRMMALLTLPLAQQISPFLSDIDRQLVSVTNAMSQTDTKDDLLLDELTKLAATVENSVSSTYYRFNAAPAYYALVERRITELREGRIQGIQTFREFMERRLAPAMLTCETTMKRQKQLSERVAHASQLLNTRVEIMRERQNQELLTSMNRRAHLQLRLQETVEGLSVVAITYYAVGLIGYLVKALKSLNLPFDYELTMGISIPVIVILTALGIRHIRQSVSQAEH